MIKKENYVVIQGWMITELNLKGAELITYAVVYGFSQAEDGGFTGGMSYLSEWTGTTKRTVMTAVAALEKRGLIEKTFETVRGVRISRLRALCEKFSPPGEIISPPSENISPSEPEEVKKLHHQGEKISPNNNTILNSNIPKEKQEKKTAAPDPFADQDLPEALREALNDYVDMRKQIKAPMSTKAKALLLTNLRKLSTDTTVQIAILNQSIMNSWKGVFPLKGNDQRQQRPSGSFYRMEEHPHTAESDAAAERNAEAASRRKFLEKWRD